MKVVLIRDVFVSSYPDCEHSAKITQAVEVDIVFPEGGVAPRDPDYSICGEWRIVQWKKGGIER